MELPVREELPSSLVVSLLGARDGSLWISTLVGLAHLVKDRLTLYQKNEGWLTMKIIEDREGKIWFRGMRLNDQARYLCQVLETGVRCYGSNEGVGFDGGALAQDPAGDFWVGGPKILVKWRPGASPQPVRVLNSGAVAQVVPESDGSAWVGIMVAGRGGGLQRLMDGTLRPFLAPKFNGETIKVSALLNDRQGTSGSGRGIAVFTESGARMWITMELPRAYRTTV